MSGSSVFENGYICRCPIWSTVYVPLSLSITLSFALMYIHTRTYWNVFMKHLHDSVLWFIFIYPFALFVCSLFVCKGDGYLSVCWYWFIISIVISGRGLSKVQFSFGGQTVRRYEACGLNLLRRNQGLVALLVTSTTAVYICVTGVGL